jgi:hypothetical protein
LLALDVFAADALVDEMPAWRELREAHVRAVRAAFASCGPSDRILLFCHDPTALPFLLREDAVRARLEQIEQTVIGHLHSPLILWKSSVLAGMPTIRFLGHTARRFSSALNDARHWKPFRVRLCPALSGVELLKDGGFYSVELDEAAGSTPRFQLHRTPA